MSRIIVNPAVSKVFWKKDVVSTELQVVAADTVVDAAVTVVDVALWHRDSAACQCTGSVSNQCCAPGLLRFWHHSTFKRLNLSVQHLQAPIAFIIAGACGWMVYKSVQHFNSPDVFLDPIRRGTGVADGKYSLSEGHEWQKRVATNYRHKGASS